MEKAIIPASCIEIGDANFADSTKDMVIVTPAGYKINNYLFYIICP